MIAIDTNVLVRLLIGDDERQYRIARDLLEAAAAAEQKCLVTHIVLVETVWVLGRSYDVPRRAIAAILREMLSSSEFEFESRPDVLSALNAFESGKADFSDYLIGRCARSHGAVEIYTFDRALRGTEGFEVLLPGPQTRK